MAQSTIKSLLVAGLVLPIGLMQGTAFAADSDTPAVSQRSPKLDLSPVNTSVKPNAAVPGVPSLNADYVEYSVPCLTVWGDGSHGKISYLPLKFTCTKEDKPLRIMIADDTPNGSGKAIHSSVWLAAVTAAMLRNDTMHGTTISVEFSGNVAAFRREDVLPLQRGFAA